MSFLELAKRRCSVRSFLDRPVEEDTLLSILEAGRWAPSACNNQPWIFVVIREKSAREQLGAVYNREWFIRAPVILAVCCDRNSSWRRSDGKDYGDVDIAIAVDHMTLAATELGVGTCWIGAFNAVEARKALLLPETIDPIIFTPIGYPAPDKPRKSRKSLDETVHWEFFGGKKR